MKKTESFKINLENDSVIENPDLQNFISNGTIPVQATFENNQIHIGRKVSKAFESLKDDEESQRIITEQDIKLKIVDKKEYIEHNDDDYDVDGEQSSESFNEDNSNNLDNYSNSSSKFAREIDYEDMHYDDNNRIIESVKEHEFPISKTKSNKSVKSKNRTNVRIMENMETGKIIFFIILI
jgi:hypothetical protein